MTADIVATLKRALADHDVQNVDVHWQPMSGGRSNLTWRFGDKICKLYRPQRSSTVFPNNAEAEAAALNILAGTHLAPDPIWFGMTSVGEALIYAYQDGQVASGPCPDLARALAQVHQRETSQLPEQSTRISSSADLVDDAETMLRACSSSYAAKLRSLRPSGIVGATSEPSFVHGDPVAANVIVLEDRVVIIDFQCASIGDPCEDLSVALSPGMQVLYGQGAISLASRQQFLDAYDNAAKIKRFNQIEPFFRYRLAAYCLWRFETGIAEYEQAFIAELKWLKAVV
jgi:thiamine kinase